MGRAAILYFIIVKIHQYFDFHPFGDGFISIQVDLSGSKDQKTAHCFKLAVVFLFAKKPIENY